MIVVERGRLCCVVFAEFVGTFAFVFFAVGSAVLGIDKIDPVGVALAFGLVLLAPSSTR